MSCTTCAGAIGRLARTKGLIATTLRYPYETRVAKEYFDDIPDVKVEPDMLKLAHHINREQGDGFRPLAVCGPL